MRQNPDLRISINQIGEAGHIQKPAVLAGQGEVDAIGIQAQGHIHIDAHRGGIEQAVGLLASVGGAVQQVKD